MVAFLYLCLNIPHVYIDAKHLLNYIVVQQGGLLWLQIN